MKRMISKMMGTGVLCAFLLSTQTVAAELCWNDWCECGDWDVGAHALYWSPVVCQWDYASSQPATAGGGIQDIDIAAITCGADWGFRVFGNYMRDCSFVGVSYQRLEAKSSRSVRGDFRLNGGNQIANVKIDASSRIECQNADFRVGQYVHRTCGCNLYLFGNVRWVDLSYRRTVLLTPPAGGQEMPMHTREKTEFQGGAIGAGLGAEFDVWCSFGLFGNANLLGVIGERKTSDIVTEPLDGESFTRRGMYTPETCILPETDFRIGVNYRYTCGCWTVVGEVGYEVDYFWDVFAFPEVVASLGGATGWVLQCENVGFSGLFFGARVLF